MAIFHIVTPEDHSSVGAENAIEIAHAAASLLGSEPAQLLPHDLNDYARMVSDRSPWRPPSYDEAAIVMLPPDDDADLTGLLDTLADRHIPAVLIGAASLMSNARLRRAGLITFVEPAPIEDAAVALATLLKRQPLIHSLARELSIANRTSGGLKGEMDRLHEELNLAACVQRDFLPKEVPTAEGLDFGILFRPCGYVSGDIYSIRPVDEFRVGFFIADAVGHGVPAALLTVVLANSLSTRDESGRPVEPADVLLRLNRAMCEQEFAASRFATAVYGLIDTRTHELTIAGAGHPPPLIIGHGSMTKIETEGPLLGVFPNAEFTQTTAMLEPGQTLLLYTDGFETACPGTDAVGKDIRRANNNYVDHAARLVRQHIDSDLPATEMIRHLRELLDLQSGSLHQVDDITAMAISPVKPAKSMHRPISKAA